MASLNAVNTVPAVGDAAGAGSGSQGGTHPVNLDPHLAALLPSWLIGDWASGGAATASRQAAEEQPPLPPPPAAEDEAKDEPAPAEDGGVTDGGVPDGGAAAKRKGASQPRRRRPHTCEFQLAPPPPMPPLQEEGGPRLPAAWLHGPSNCLYVREAVLDELVCEMFHLLPTCPPAKMEFVGPMTGGDRRSFLFHHVCSMEANSFNTFWRRVGATSVDLLDANGVPIPVERRAAHRSGGDGGEATVSHADAAAMQLLSCVNETAVPLDPPVEGASELEERRRRERNKKRIQRWRQTQSAAHHVLLVLPEVRDLDQLPKLYEAARVGASVSHARPKKTEGDATVERGRKRRLSSGALSKLPSEAEHGTDAEQHGTAAELHGQAPGVAETVAQGWWPEARAGGPVLYDGWGNVVGGEGGDADVGVGRKRRRRDSDDEEYRPPSASDDGSDGEGAKRHAKRKRPAPAPTDSTAAAAKRGRAKKTAAVPSRDGAPATLGAALGPLAIPMVGFMGAWQLPATLTKAQMEGDGMGDEPDAAAAH